MGLRMNRPRGATLAALLVASWFLMQAVHELGHVLAAWLTGGAVQRVVLSPLEISRTDVMPNPRPLVVANRPSCSPLSVPMSLRTVATLLIPPPARGRHARSMRVVSGVATR